ncbi:MAG: MFS transporter, partial [Micromonosporaceae bacterium]|nr:MFS transporter [Micromonosporaceae bacterium]
MTQRGTGSDRVRHPVVGMLAAALIAATAVLFLPGAGTRAAAAPAQPGGCTTAQWQDTRQLSTCVAALPPLSQQELACLQAPVPAKPSDGLGGFFASPPSTPPSFADDLYSRYGYAGYRYTMYDNGCVDQVSHLDQQTYNTAANLELNVATGIIGAANALRERAWEPASMWGWANPLVKDATQSIYRKVFTVFGAITLAIVGLYLLWRSRQSDMSAAMTTAGWAVLVMVAVTAIAAWPVRAANAADSSLLTGLNVVHSAVGPPPETPPAGCGSGVSCQDLRTPARRASDTAVRNMLYRNWLRGELGSADSPVAQKYGLALYDATALSWSDIADIQNGA